MKRAETKMKQALKAAEQAAENVERLHEPTELLLANKVGGVEHHVEGVAARHREGPLKLPELHRCPEPLADMADCAGNELLTDRGR